MMDTKHIYEHIRYDSLADYQIKVRGDFSELAKMFKKFRNISVSSESSEPSLPITMLTAKRINQTVLFTLITQLHAHGYPFISMVCADVEKNGDRSQNNGKSAALTA